MIDPSCKQPYKLFIFSHFYDHVKIMYSLKFWCIALIIIFIIAIVTCQYKLVALISLTTLFILAFYELLQCGGMSQCGVSQCGKMPYYDTPPQCGKMSHCGYGVPNRPVMPVARDNREEFPVQNYRGSITFPGGGDNQILHNITDAPCTDFDTTNDELDGDELMVNQYITRGDTEVRSIIGSMDLRTNMDKYYRAEMDESENKRWWGNHEV